MSIERLDPILYSNLLYKMGQDLLDLQYQIYISGGFFDEFKSVGHFSKLLQCCSNEEA